MPENVVGILAWCPQRDSMAFERWRFGHACSAVDQKHHERLGDLNARSMLAIHMGHFPIQLDPGPSGAHTPSTRPLRSADGAPLLCPSAAGGDTRARFARAGAHEPRDAPQRMR